MVSLLSSDLWPVGLHLTLASLPTGSICNVRQNQKKGATETEERNDLGYLRWDASTFRSGCSALETRASLTISAYTVENPRYIQSGNHV